AVAGRGVDDGRAPFTELSYEREVSEARVRGELVVRREAGAADAKELGARVGSQGEHGVAERLHRVFFRAVSGERPGEGSFRRRPADALGVEPEEVAADMK